MVKLHTGRAGNVWIPWPWLKDGNQWCYQGKSPLLVPARARFQTGESIPSYDCWRGSSGLCYRADAGTYFSRRLVLSRGTNCSVGSSVGGSGRAPGATEVAGAGDEHPWHQALASPLCLHSTRWKGPQMPLRVPGSFAFFLICAHYHLLNKRAQLFTAISNRLAGAVSPVPTSSQLKKGDFSGCSSGILLLSVTTSARGRLVLY